MVYRLGRHEWGWCRNGLNDEDHDGDRGKNRWRRCTKRSTRHHEDGSSFMGGSGEESGLMDLDELQRKVKKGDEEELSGREGQER